jgi:hypothetical protein
MMFVPWLWICWSIARARAGAERDHGDHRGDADDHSQHRQRGATLLRRIALSAMPEVLVISSHASSGGGSAANSCAASRRFRPRLVLHHAPVAEHDRARARTRRCRARG